MSALVEFDEGEVSPKSPTFATVVTALLERSTDPADRETCTDALVGNSLWPDQIPQHRKDAVLAALWEVLADQLDSGAHDDNPTAIFQIRQLRAELLRRYYGPLTRQVPGLAEAVRRQEDAGRLRATVLALLDESPISREDVRTDVRESVQAGEFELAFDTLCGWIAEDQVEIERDHCLRLVETAEVLNSFTAVGALLRSVRA